MYKRLLTVACVALVASCSDINPVGVGEPVFVGNSPVVFSEINAGNTYYKDEFGETPGFVKFYNPADTAVNLKDYSLTDGKTVWTFGEAVVLPNNYLTVFFSGKNKPDYVSPSDSVSLIDSAVGEWHWADISNGGRGTADASLSETKITGTITTRDNSPALDWSGAEIMMVLNGWDTTATVDITGRNQVLLRGYLNSRMEVRLARAGAKWATTISGTGNPNDLYIIELPASYLNAPGAGQIYGISFANTGEYGTISFSFNSIVVQKKAGNVHASFKLNKNGGKLLLTDSYKQIRDSATYAPKDLSFAKEIPSSGYYETLSFTLPNDIRCETSGALPNENSMLKDGSTLTLTKTTVLRCVQFKNGVLSEPVMRTYIIGERLPALPVVSIAVNPDDMFNPTTGIYMEGPNASAADPHKGANYWKEIELPVQLDFFESEAKHAWSYSAGLRIFGNYSRMNDKKSVGIGFKGKYGTKKLNYPLFPEHPHITKFNWFVLRNNGNNYGKDYIRDMLMTSLTEGLGIDYQKGRAVIVYYNGAYYGIHNLRERANKDYFESNYGIDESYLDLVKNSDDVRSGSDASYQKMMQWIKGAQMNDEDIEELKKVIDLDNYTNYVQSQVYFKNQDWPGNNIKRWRSSMTSSKWKWLMYDTDFGFEGAVITGKGWMKMLDYITEENSTVYQNLPNATLLIRQLFKNESYKTAFINRFSLLLATYYAPQRVQAKIDALMGAIESEIPEDQKRWKSNVNEMNRQLTIIKNFGRDRAAEMQREMEQFFGLANPVDFTVSVSGNGKVLVNGLPVLNGRATFKAYPAKPVTIKAVPNSGAKFIEWNNGDTNAEREIWVQGAMNLEARF